MDNPHIDRAVSAAWRCAACGRLALFRQWRAQPDRCAGCRGASFEPAAQSLSIWRLIGD
jgi:uncharacterized protein (DUF983 family)